MCYSPLPPLTANWIIRAKPTASQLQKEGWGLNIELHPVKIQIYRCSALSISGFNVIFILQSSQSLCPSTTFRLKTDRARQTNILLSDVKDLTSFTNISLWKRTRALSQERAPSSHSQLLFFVSFYSFISSLFLRPTLILLPFLFVFSPSLPYPLLLCSHSSFSPFVFLFSINSLIIIFLLPLSLFLLLRLILFSPLF
jgi:hypothetical protein